MSCLLDAALFGLSTVSVQRLISSVNLVDYSILWQESGDSTTVIVCTNVCVSSSVLIVW